MQNMNVSCRMMWAGFLGLKVMWVMAVSLRSHSECSPCFCSFRLHSVYSFCFREYSKTCITTKHCYTSAVCYKGGNPAAAFTCWSACTEIRWLLSGWMAMAVGQELYTGSVKWSCRETETCHYWCFGESNDLDKQYDRTFSLRRLNTCISQSVFAVASHFPSSLADSRWTGCVDAGHGRKQKLLENAKTMRYMQSWTLKTMVQDCIYLRSGAKPLKLPYAKSCYKRKKLPVYCSFKAFLMFKSIIHLLKTWYNIV